MPKKKIKGDVVTTAEGLVLDAEQTAMFMQQAREGSYSLGAPEVIVTDDEIAVKVSSTVYTILGDSLLLTTAAFCNDDVEQAVRYVLERARDAAEATIKAVNDDEAENVVSADDEDEGLREGAPFQSVAIPSEVSHVGVAADPIVSDPYSPEALLYSARSRVRRAEAALVVAEAESRKGGLFASVRLNLAKNELTNAKVALRREEDFQAKAAVIEARVTNDWSKIPSDAVLKRGVEQDDDTVAIPNAEYASLIKGKRHAESRLEMFRAELQSVPEGGSVTLPDGERVQIRTGNYKALEAIWTALGNYPYERPVTGRFDDSTGEISLEDFVAATTTGPSDMSDTAHDDGGPVEPELDIDALVAKAAA